MKIEQPLLKFIKNVVNAATTVGIENVVIERGKVRAIEKGKDESVVLIVHSDVPELPFDVIALTRIDTFMNRLSIAESYNDLIIDATTKTAFDHKLNKERMFASGLSMTSKRFKVEYRCANPAAIKTPNAIHDVFVHAVPYDDDGINMLTKGISAMSANLVTMVAKDNSVAFEIVDINNDIFSYTFTNDVTSEDGTPCNFVHRYPAKQLLSMLKHNQKQTFYIGQDGMLKVLINGIEVVLMAKA